MMTNNMTLICLQVTSQSHSSVVGQTVGVPAHHGHAAPAPALAHAVPAHAHAGHAGHASHVGHAAHAAHTGHAGHAGHALGKREADADADAQLVGPDS